MNGFYADMVLFLIVLVICFGIAANNLGTIAENKAQRKRMGELVTMTTALETRIKQGKEEEFYGE